MPIKAEVTQTQSGELEQAHVCLASELDDYMTENDLEDAILIIIPDTGKARFQGKRAQKRDASKTTKATFVVAEIGGSYAGEQIPYRQSSGDVEGLPLSIKLSVTATPPNRDAETVDAALGRSLTIVKTGTDN